MQGRSIGVSYKPQALANNLLLFGVKVLEDVVFGADDGHRDGKGVQQVFVLGTARVGSCD